MTKYERCEVANQLIKIISDYGRRFFYYGKLDRVARFEVDARGKIWFWDDYTNERIYTHNKGYWREFSHGGTLKSLVDAMVEYIRSGTKINVYWLGPQREGLHKNNIWGYNEYGMTKVRELGSVLDIIESPDKKEGA